MIQYLEQDTISLILMPYMPHHATSIIKNYELLSYETLIGYALSTYRLYPRSQNKDCYWGIASSLLDTPHKYHIVPQQIIRNYQGD
jgi:hypothetical protein